jgi:sensor domain CHASE-containing protein
MFSGCVTDKPYAVGKVIYTGAKTVYIELPMPENKTLEDMDMILVKYDKARSSVKEVLSKKKEEDVSTLQ